MNLDNCGICATNPNFCSRHKPKPFEDCDSIEPENCAKHGDEAKEWQKSLETYEARFGGLHMGDFSDALLEQATKPKPLPFRKIYSLAELKALPMDSIVGKENTVFQKWLPNTDPEHVDGNGDPFIWGQIGDEQEFLSDGGVWYCLAECYEDFDHKGKCAEHTWCWVYHE